MKKLSLLLTLALGQSAAFAQSMSTVTVPASAVPQSVTSSAQQAPKKKELPLSLNLWSDFHGPRLNDANGKFITDGEIEQTRGIWSRHRVNLRYNLGGGRTISPTADFVHNFTDRNRDKVNTSELRDWFVTFRQANLIEGDIKNNSISVDTGLRLYAPMSKNSRDTDNLGTARFYLSPSVQFGSSPFSISVENFFQTKFYASGANEKHPTANRFELYTGPQLNYQISRKVVAFVLFETTYDWDNAGRLSSSVNPNESTSDLEPGVEIQLNRTITLMPYLNWYLNQKVSTTTYNVQATINLL